MLFFGSYTYTYKDSVCSNLQSTVSVLMRLKLWRWQMKQAKNKVKCESEMSTFLILIKNTIIIISYPTIYRLHYSLCILEATHISKSIMFWNSNIFPHPEKWAQVKVFFTKKIIGSSPGFVPLQSQDGCQWFDKSVSLVVYWNWVNNRPITSV